MRKLLFGIIFWCVSHSQIALPYCKDVFRANKLTAQLVLDTIERDPKNRPKGVKTYMIPNDWSHDAESRHHLARILNELRMETGETWMLVRISSHVGYGVRESREALVSDPNSSNPSSNLLADFQWAQWANISDSNKKESPRTRSSKFRYPELPVDQVEVILMTSPASRREAGDFHRETLTPPWSNLSMIGDFGLEVVALNGTIHAFNRLDNHLQPMIAKTDIKTEQPKPPRQALHPIPKNSEMTPEELRDYIKANISHLSDLRKFLTDSQTMTSDSPQFILGKDGPRVETFEEWLEKAEPLRVPRGGGGHIIWPNFFQERHAVQIYLKHRSPYHGIMIRAVILYTYTVDFEYFEIDSD